jgi:predicted ester cyclase
VGGFAASLVTNGRAPADLGALTPPRVVRRMARTEREAVDVTRAPRSAPETRTFFDRWIGSSNRGEWDELATMMHDEILITDPMMPEPAEGKVAAIERARAQYEPFPDGVVTMIGDPFVALDQPELAYRWRFTGTHLRAVKSPGFAPSGRSVEVDGCSVLRFRHGHVVAVDLFFDTTSVARQLLAAPLAGSPMESVIALSQRLRVRAHRLSARRARRRGSR